MAAVAFFNLAGLAEQQRADLPREVSFLAPVQQAGSALTVEVSNLADKLSVLGFIGHAWPALFALAVWGYGRLTDKQWFRSGGWIAGWMLLAWAALRCPNGAEAFLVIIAAFLLVHVVIPALRQLWRLPRQSAPAAEGGATPAAATLLVGGLLWLSLGCATYAKEPLGAPALAESVTQDIRIEEKFALATAKIRWQAEKGQALPLLLEPAVLTHISYESNALKLVQAPAGAGRAQELLAQKNGAFDIVVQYELPVAKRDAESGLTLPVQYGLINRLNLTLVNLDVDVLSPRAVSVQREISGSNTVASLVLSPGAGT